MTFISIAVASIPSFAQWGIPQAVTKLKQVCANSVAGQVSCWYVAVEAYDAAKPYVHSAGRVIVNGASNAANLAVPGCEIQFTGKAGQILCIPTRAILTRGMIFCALSSGAFVLMAGSITTANELMQIQSS